MLVGSRLACVDTCTVSSLQGLCVCVSACAGRRKTDRFGDLGPCLQWSVAPVSTCHSDIFSIDLGSHRGGEHTMQMHFKFMTHNGSRAGFIASVDVFQLFPLFPNSAAFVDDFLLFNIYFL